MDASMTAWPDPENGAAAVPLQDGVVARLRRAMRAIERAVVGEPMGFVPLGAPPVDAALGGGFLRGSLHEISALREAEMPAASGFALALAVRCPGPVVWVAEDMGLIESGAPYGPGLDDLGLAPERLTTVTVTRSSELLWAAEEALGCHGIGAVVGESRSAHVDLTATRRLSLAASRCGGLALLVRSQASPEASAAATRWIVKAAPSDAGAGRAAGIGPGPPRFALTLTRNRRGPPGSWVLEWNCVDQRFDLQPADRVPVAQTAFDRPREAAGA